MYNDLEIRVIRYGRNGIERFVLDSLIQYNIMQEIIFY